MRDSIGVVCCLMLLFNGVLASRSSGSLSISSSSGSGGSSITVNQQSSAQGPGATALISTSGKAATEHSEAAVDQNSIAVSDAHNTDVSVNTKAHTIGNGHVHGTGDAVAENHHSDAAANQKVVVESDHGGAAGVDTAAGVASDLLGADATIVQTGGSIGSGSAVVTGEVTGGNYEGGIAAKQHLAAGSEAGGASDARAELVAGFDHWRGSRLNSLLRGFTQNGGAVITGSEGAAVGYDGVSAGKTNLEVESHPRKGFGIDRSSYGLIYGGTHGGMANAESTAGAEGDVIKDGTVAATAEFGSQGNYKENGVKASLLLDAEEPEPQPQHYQPNLGYRNDDYAPSHPQSHSPRSRYGKRLGQQLRYF